MNLRTTFESFSRYSDAAIEDIIEGSKFKDTITPWNHLNKPISVGQCLHLYKLLGATSTHDFAMRYLDSGEELQRLLLERPKSEHAILKKLHGRTESEVLTVAHKFLNKLDPAIYSLEEVLLYMWIRMFYQTNVGAKRERLTARSLRVKHPELALKESTAQLDLDYGIDFEFYQDEQLVCGLQIKPESYYFSHSPNTQSAKYQNAQKHQAYSDCYQVPVCYVIATQEGEILTMFTSTEPRQFHRFDYEHPHLQQFNNYQSKSVS